MMFDTTRAPRSRGAALSALSIAFLFSLTAHAGQDKARINADGSVDFHVHYGYAPSQQDVLETESMIRAAHDVMCDATEGNMYFGDVTISAGNAGEAIADVWLLAPGLWTRSSNSGFILEDGGARIFLTSQGRTFTTLAHELGHALFRLPDAYNEQSRLGGYFGIGYAIDPGTCSNTGDRCIEDADCGTAPGALCFFNRISQTENTMMAGVFHAPRCVGDPDTKCWRGDIDCGVGDVCELPKYYSEFLLPASYDTLSGNGGACPGPLPADQLLIEGRLASGNPAQAIDLSSFEDADDTHSGRRTVRIIDSQGVLTGYERDSSHNLYIYAEYHDDVNKRWRLHFAMDGKHLDGQTDGDLVQLPVKIDGQAQVNGLALDVLSGGATYPTDGGAADAIAVCPDGEPCAAPGTHAIVVEIPMFENGAPGIALSVDVANLVSRDWTSYYLGRTKVLAANGGQQVGDCAASVAATETTSDDNLCTVNYCGARWNSSTKRWEAAAYTYRPLQGLSAWDSEWHRMAHQYIEYSPQNLPVEEAFNVALQVPQAISPNQMNCPQVNIVTNVTGHDSMVLLIDTSGSMKTDYDAAGVTKPRIEWAKAGSRALADLVETNNQDVTNAGSGTYQSIGVATFDNAPTNVLDPVQMGHPTETMTSDDFDLLVDAIDAGGATALADGLYTAGGMTEGMNPAVVALTDGEANICKDGKDPDNHPCDAMDDAVTAVGDLFDDDIDVYFTPLGGELGQGVFGDAPVVGSGEVYPAQSGREVPLQFTRMYLRFSGFAPILDGAKYSVYPNSGGIPWDWDTFKIPVEQGADQLTVLLSTTNDDVATFGTMFEIEDPDGTVYDDNSAAVTITDDDGNFYRIIRLPANVEGVWRLRVASANVHMQDGYAIAWTNTRAPDCFAGVSTPEVRAVGETVEISALASWDTPLIDVDYKADVIRPDGSKVSVSLSRNDPDSPELRGTFASYQGRGMYTVALSCSTYNSSFHYGEDPSAHELGEEQVHTPPAPMYGPGFYRETSTTFFVDIPDSTLPPGTDCDSDGVSNDNEGLTCDITGNCTLPGTDTDGDGLIDACDNDSDNDDVPDGDEPAGDVDGDGIDNILDPDSDNDGLDDGVDPWPYLPPRRLHTGAPSTERIATMTRDAVTGVDWLTAQASARLVTVVGYPVASVTL